MLFKSWSDVHQLRELAEKRRQTASYTDDGIFYRQLLRDAIAAEKEADEMEEQLKEEGIDNGCIFHSG